ncbi:MAG: peptide chain release factor 1, partial [Acidobacteriota bacterium]
AEQRRTEIDQLLADPTTHADGDRMRALSRERAGLDDELASLYEVWEQAARAVEQLEQEE